MNDKPNFDDLSEMVASSGVMRFEINTRTQQEIEADMAWLLVRIFLALQDDDSVPDSLHNQGIELIREMGLWK